MKDKLFINTLKSFNELTKDDQKKCQDLFERPLHHKIKKYKYMKFTQEILQKFPDESQKKPYFLTFQTISLHDKYSALIFSLCGIFESFHLIIYFGVFEDEKVQKKEILSEMESSICSKFLFIADPGYWRYSNMHNPYAQNTSFEILNTSITAENIEEIFDKYRKIAGTKNIQYLEQFLMDFYRLSRVLLTDNMSITLHLCTLECVDNFEIIIRSHMEALKEHITRKLIFELLRALIIIYGR
ncbi:uncharacterized protein LOC27209255 isoform X2 [Drosophila simulans]|uniref:uncharacterized protein LOC27209255 isoform X2 n=1 Tax=Drosophila simulans TaxID=7240 RepID=UPI001D1206B7|nr:uncharacterized protein LOC27209255 isoform X2 [Drosophila simulans]